MITRFKTYIQDIKGYSTNTVKAYEKDLRNFASWMREHKTDARWSTIERSDIDAYMIHLSTGDHKPATINRHLAALASLYRYFQREGLRTDNPVKYESRKKLAKTEPNVIEVAAIRAAISNSQPRARVAISLLWSTGIRAQELCDAKWEDIDLVNRTIRVTGKGGKQRTVYFNQETARLLTWYGYGRRGSIFHYNDQRELREEVFIALQPYSSAPQLSPHAIRHTFATVMTRKGMPITTLAYILGHESIKTTQKYIATSGKDIKEQYIRFN